MSEPTGQLPNETEGRVLVALTQRAARQAGAGGTDLDDVAQAVVEKLLARWGTPEVEDVRQRSVQWHAYVYATARHAFYDLVRSRNRRRQREVRATRGVDGSPLPDRPGVVRTQALVASDVDRYLARLEIVSIIGEAGLTNIQQVVATLYFVDGLDNQRIALELGISVQLVNRHRRTATRALRAKLTASVVSNSAGSGLR